MGSLTRHTLYSQLLPATLQEQMLYRELLTFQDAETPSLVHNFWNEDGWFLSGFWQYITRSFYERGIKLQTSEAPQYPLATELPDTCRNVQEVWDKLRPIQRYAAGCLYAEKGAIAKVPTRGGKTYIMTGVYRAQNSPLTLVIVPTHTIMTQAQEEMSDLLREHVGALGGGKKDIRQLTFATTQSLLDTSVESDWPAIRPEYSEYLHSVKSIVWDEIQAHGRMFVSINQACDTAIYRHGYSATPFTGRTWWDTSAVGFLGPVHLSIPSIYLANTGDLEHAACFFWAFEYRPIGKPSEWHTYYKDNIVDNDKRNQLIAQIALSYIGRGQNCLIFAEHRRHLRKLQALIPDSVILSSKDTNRKQQAEIRDKFNKREIQCVIVTKLWRLGITLQCDSGINAGGGKGGATGYNEVQMLGRGLMPKGKTFHWNDLMDHMPDQYGVGKMGDQAANRLNACLEEGWPVHLITDRKDAHQVNSFGEVQDILLPHRNEFLKLGES